MNIILKNFFSSGNFVLAISVYITLHTKLFGIINFPLCDAVCDDVIGLLIMGHIRYNSIHVLYVQAEEMASKEVAARNIDHVFVEVTEELTCSICKEILHEPHLINCCGQQFCGHCLKKWLLKNKTCPHCSSKNFSHMLMQPTIRKIKNLAIFCPNKQQGCKVELSISQCERHLSTRCLYVKLECLNCTTSVFRGEMQTHLQNECPRRSDTCTYCGKQGEHQYIMGAHLNCCLLYPVCFPFSELPLRFPQLVSTK